MKGFDLWKLMMKRALPLVWVCGIFALLFALVFFSGFVRRDLTEGLYRDILEEAEGEQLVFSCDYDPALAQELEIGVYASAEGETYNVTLSAGGQSLEVDRYGRGLILCRVLPAWQALVEGEPLEEGEGIWLSEALVPAGLEIGGEVRIEETGQVFRLAGTFSGEIRSALRLGFSPSFLLAEDRAFAEASMICPAEEVFPLWQSALGARVSGDDGLFDLCEGYALAGGWLEVLFWLIAAAALLVAVRMTAFFLRHFARQTFLLRVFGLSRGRLILLYAGVLLAYGALGFALGVGLFYAFVGITEALSSGIMGMVFGEVSPLPMFALGGAVFALAAAGTAAAVLSGREGGQP